jgi:hypothetical protein
MLTSNGIDPLAWWLEAAATDTEIAFHDAHERFLAQKAAVVIGKYGVPHGPDNTDLWRVHGIAPRRSWLLIFQLITGPDNERSDIRDRLFNKGDSDILDALITHRLRTAGADREDSRRHLREKLDLWEVAVCDSDDEVFDDLVAHLVLPAEDARSFALSTRH